MCTYSLGRSSLCWGSISGALCMTLPSLFVFFYKAVVYEGMTYNELRLEIEFTRAAPAFDNLFMGCVFNINTVHKTVEKLTFQAFY